jgi:hypothetical protein
MLPAHPRRILTQSADVRREGKPCKRKHAETTELRSIPERSNMTDTEIAIMNLQSVLRHIDKRVSRLEGTERSEALQGCLPSANCSAGAGADALSDSLNSSVVPREKAEPAGTSVSSGQWTVHVIGPDDIYEEPDELTALRHANALNQYIADDRRANGFRPNEPFALAVVKQAGLEASAPPALPPQGERALARND